MHIKYLTDPVGYLEKISKEEKEVYYMGYEHAKQEISKGRVADLMALNEHLRHKLDLIKSIL